MIANWLRQYQAPLKVYTVSLNLDGEYVETVIVMATDWNDAERKALRTPLQVPTETTKQVMSIRRGQ